MPESILDVAEGERACRGSHVDHQDQSDRILRREAERLFGVNRSQRDDRLDPRLSDSPWASWGKNAAIRFPPEPKQKLKNTSSTTAMASVPGPVNASKAVAITQPAVVRTSRRFFAARKSA